MTASTLEQGLRDLGWTATADSVRRGDVWPATVRDRLRSALRRKRGFLAGHSFRSGTCGEETHERVASWCDRAEAFLASLADPDQDKGMQDG